MRRGEKRESALMTSYDFICLLIPTIFTFLIHMSVGGPLVVIITYTHHSVIEMAHQ